MKRKFVRILVVALAAFALFAFAYPDDLSENEMLNESSVRIPTHWDRQGAHRDHQALAVDSTRFAANKSTCSPSSSERTTSPILLSLAACVLRC